MEMITNDALGVRPEASGGLAAWLLLHFGGRVRGRFRLLGRVREERRMKLAETLSLGGKRQLMLVLCDGQRYLVGASGEGVETIVAMTPEVVRSETQPSPRLVKERGF